MASKYEIMMLGRHDAASFFNYCLEGMSYMAGFLLQCSRKEESFAVLVKLMEHKKFRPSRSCCRDFQH